MKTLLAALALSIAPAFASAACFSDHSSTASMSCADGHMWDAEQQTCVPTTTS